MLLEDLHRAYPRTQDSGVEWSSTSTVGRQRRRTDKSDTAKLVIKYTGVDLFPLRTTIGTSKLPITPTRNTSTITGVETHTKKSGRAISTVEASLVEELPCVPFSVVKYRGGGTGVEKFIASR